MSWVIKADDYNPYIHTRNRKPSEKPMDTEYTTPKPAPISEEHGEKPEFFPSETMLEKCRESGGINIPLTQEQYDEFNKMEGFRAGENYTLMKEHEGVTVGLTGDQLFDLVNVLLAKREGAASWGHPDEGLNRDLLEYILNYLRLDYSMVVQATDDIEQAIVEWQKVNPDKEVIGRNEMGVWYNLPNHSTGIALWDEIRQYIGHMVAEQEG